MAHTLAQCVMPAFRFGIHKTQEAEKLVKAGVAGFCLYGGTASEIAKLTARLQSKSAYRLLFASDFENGAGSQAADMTEFPSNMAVGRSGNLEHARLKGAITARQAKSLGINWIFAPVVDLSVRPDNPIVNIRSFGDDPEKVTRMARAFLEGLQSEGVAGCLKHFPGHGETSMDSHLDLASIETNWETLRDQHMHPYFLLANEAGSVMTGHLVLKGKDPDPASLSEFWIKRVLRTDVGFRGLVVTDALMMGAIEKRYGQAEAVRMALEAGTDILLYPKDPWAALKTIESFEHSKTLRRHLDESAQRLRVFRNQLYTWKKPLGSTKIKTLEKRNYKSVLEMAKNGLAWLSPAKTFEPWASGPLAYEEFGNKKIKLNGSSAVRLMHDRASSKETFSRLLQKSGLRPEKVSKNNPKQVILAAVFHKPRAFSGKIGLEDSEIRRIRELAALPAASKLVISFGDPYIAKQIPSSLPVLGCFSDCKASQEAAIEFLKTGKLSAQPEAVAA